MNKPHNCSNQTPHTWVLLHRTWSARVREHQYSLPPAQSDIAYSLYAYVLRFRNRDSCRTPNHSDSAQVQEARSMWNICNPCIFHNPDIHSPYRYLPFPYSKRGCVRFFPRLNCSEFLRNPNTRYRSRLRSCTWANLFLSHFRYAFASLRAYIFHIRIYKDIFRQFCTQRVLAPYALAPIRVRVLSTKRNFFHYIPSVPYTHNSA